MDYQTNGETTERFYRKMGEPSWLILRAIQQLGRASRSAITKQVRASLAVAGAQTSNLDPSTLHYALQRMEADGIIATLGEESAPLVHGVAEPAVAYHTGKRPAPSFALTPVGTMLLAMRQRRIAVEVIMDAPIIQRPKPTVLGIAASGHRDTSERAGEERPKPLEWRS